MTDPRPQPTVLANRGFLSIGGYLVLISKGLPWTIVFGKFHVLYTLNAPYVFFQKRVGAL
jgi:hypothetical protein